MATSKDIDSVVAPDTSSSDDDHTSKEVGAIAVTEVNIGSEFRTTSRWRKIVGYVWDSVEGDPKYRRYVQRLDLFFL
jgi:ACS family pantothenate transporter-like MFS transporter